MTDRTPRITRTILLLGFATLICCGSSAMWLSSQQRTAESWVRHTFEVGAQLDRVEIAAMLVEIERPGLVVVNPDDGGRKLSHAIDGLAWLTRDNVRQQVRIRNLRRAVDGWLAHRMRAAAPSRAVQLDTTTPRMRDVLTQLRRAEEHLLRVRLARSAQIETTARTVLTAGLMLAILLAGAAYLDRRRRMQLLAEANARLAEENEKLEHAEIGSRAAVTKLSDANRLLLMTENVAQIGHWRLDLVADSLFWSDVVCSIHGVPPGHVPQLASAIGAYHPDDRVRVRAMVEHALSAGVDFDFRSRIVREDGAVRHVTSRGRVERSAAGAIVALFGVLQDVTLAVEAEAALVDASRRVAESNRLLTFAEAMGKLGHWRVNRHVGTTFWSKEVLNIFGFPPDTVPATETALATYHPDDVARVRATVDAALAAGTGYTSHARIIRPDGTLAHIRTRAEFELDASGAPAGLFGIVQDVTEQVTAEAQRQTQEAQYRLITDEASDLIVITDEAGTLLFVSPSSRTVLGYRPEEMIGTTPYDYAPVEDRPLLDRQWAELRTRPAGEVIPLRFRMRRKDGVHVWIDVAARIAPYQDAPRVVSVCRDVTAQVESERALRHARAQAEAAASAKASFLANMSHEIRTPMNGVIGFTELLGESDLQPEQRKQVELIADSGRAMMRLLNDILDLSKVEAGQMKIANEPFDVAHALKACMKLVAPAIAKKGLHCDCDISPSLPPLVLGDGLRLRQIVLNLLGNAIKFTEQGGITLRAWRDADANVVIEIEDTGIGIEPDRQEAIFEQFVQADSGIVSRFGGTGLGLAISAQLARLMGGAVRLKSTPGEGSRFSLTVSLAAAAERRTAAQEAVAPAASPAASTDNAVPRVLVAEDHDVNQLLVTAMLRQLGYRCDIAADGGQAVAMVQDEIVRGHPYAIVLMDMQMPVLGGIDATRRIRADGVATDRLPIVALTANAYADDIAACLQAGMQAHLSKPLHLADLRSALTRWIVPSAAVVPATPMLDANVRARYGQRRDEALATIGALVRSGRIEGIDFSEVAEMLHKLVGTAGMFGDADVGARAHELEVGLRSWSGAELERKVPGALAALLAAA